MDRSNGEKMAPLSSEREELWALLQQEMGFAPSPAIAITPRHLTDGRLPLSFAQGTW